VNWNPEITHGFIDSQFLLGEGLAVHHVQAVFSTSRRIVRQSAVIIGKRGADFLMGCAAVLS
jgi:hypothetical protein